MILNIVIAFAATLLFMSLVSNIVRALGGGWLTVLFLQMGVSTITASILFGSGFLVFWPAIGLALLPIVVRMFIFGYYYHRTKKYLSGDRGDASMWAAELVTEGNDEEFKKAVSSLDETDIREIGILAENKEELREMTVERADE